MADWVVAAIGYFTRGLNRILVSAQRQGRWAKEDFTMGRSDAQFRELRLGVFDWRHRTAVARRGLALGMKCRACGAGRSAAPQRHRVGRRSWADLARLSGGSDVLVIARRNTTETLERWTVGVLERLAHQALVVNVSRGIIARMRRRCSSCWSGAVDRGRHSTSSQPSRCPRDMLLDPSTRARGADVSAVSAASGSGKRFDRGEHPSYLAGAPLTNPRRPGSRVLNGKDHQGRGGSRGVRLHIKAGDVFRARIDGKLVPLTKQRLTPDQTKAIAQRLIAMTRTADASTSSATTTARGACPDRAASASTSCRQRSSFMIVMRVIRSTPTFESLKLPACSRSGKRRRGMILVTG